MTSRTRRSVICAAAAWAACLLSSASLGGQAAPSRALLAEEVFGNVQVLRGTTVNEFMGTMGIFSVALGMSCGDCHTTGDAKWENYADESPRKQMARAMVTMMASINDTYFGGRQAVTCFSCHRGTDRPKPTPALADFYGAPPPDDPRDIVEQAPFSPPPDEVFDRYIEVVGGAEPAAALTSISGRGTSTGYGPDGEARPFEIVSQAPNRRTTIVRSPSGDSVTTFDGRNGWMSAPFRPVAVLALSGADLDGLRLDAELSFPARIRDIAGNWRVGLPKVVDGRDVQMVQGTGVGGATVTLFFDTESGLLVRQIRYVGSPVGRLPTQVDYGDYREVAGVRVPFVWTVTWLGGRDTIELTDVQANVDVDPVRFAQPAPPVATPAAGAEAR